MYYALIKNGNVSLYSRKIDCIYDHIKFNRKHRVKFKEIRKRIGDRMMNKGEAKLVC